MSEVDTAVVYESNLREFPHIYIEELKKMFYKKLETDFEKDY